MIDPESLSRLHGLFVGQLTEAERGQLKDAIESGLASVSYRGAAGLMGLGKVQVYTTTTR